MKKFYLAIQICRNEKYAAYLLPVPDFQNVYAMLKDIPDIVCATICATKTAARATVNAWNEMFKNTGVYLFDNL